MPSKIAMVSLGCPKNQVDAEIMLAALAGAGMEITTRADEADAIIVNTCGFIEDAKRESIENILDIAEYKKFGKLKALVVTGCLAERYRDEITKEIPEVDVVVGIGSNGKIAEIIRGALMAEAENTYGDKCLLPLGGGRMLSTPKYWTYLKIAEGCDNCCTYCAIPSIRGRFRSRTLEDVLAEAEELVRGGVKELVLVAQDTTRYGEDLYGRQMLPELLRRLCALEGLLWIRLLYCYPDRITDELLSVMREQPKVLPYLDLPLQHCSGTVLQAMNRRGDRAWLTGVIKKIRHALPDVTLRTTLIAGFPGETEEDFTELCEFVREIRFDRLGCFAYSAEEGTPAAEFPGQVEEETKARRMETIMDMQAGIAEGLSRGKIGREETVLVEGYDPSVKRYFGRTKADAPEIDCKVFFTCDTPLQEGDFVPVLIGDVLEYDLMGEARVSGKGGSR